MSLLSWLTRRRRSGRRWPAALLFVLPLPLLIKAIVSLWSGHVGMLLASGGAYVFFLVAALVVRQGLINEDAFDARPHGGSPPPLKALGGALVGLATAFAAFAAAGQPMPGALAFGAIAALGYFLFYGPDPRARRLVAGDRGAEADVSAALREAYDRLDRIRQASLQIPSLEFKDRLANIIAGAQNVLKAIEDDPRDLRRARKFLNVYLDGAQRVTEQYARTHPQAKSVELEHNFRTLLVEMENICHEQHQKLIQHDVLDLDVQIEVLNTRLKQEGVV